MRRLLLGTVAVCTRRMPLSREDGCVLRLGRKLAGGLTADRGTAVVRTRHGFKMRTRLDCAMLREIFLSGTWAPDATRLLQRTLARGDTFADIGAGAGYFTLLGSRAVGSEGRVLAVEPDPEARAELEANLERNRRYNSTVLSLAASDDAGEILLRPSVNGRPAVTALSAGLDDSLQAERIALVRIGCAGAAHRALAGMVGILERDRPVLLVEVADESLRARGSSSALLGRFLAELGYGVHRVVPGRGPVPLTTGRFGQQRRAFTCLCAR